MRTVTDILHITAKKGWKILDHNIDGIAFVLYHKGRKRTVIASWGGGWEHVSINDMKETPTWEEMCELKDIFWKEDESVVQYHPAKSEYVNNLEHCLHLWKPIEKYSGALPIPDSLLVGIKGVKLSKEDKERLLQCVLCANDPDTCGCTEADEDETGLCTKYKKRG